ncbi:putative lipase/esterase [Thozetella sp. PMI_491]|nr:putative lipase/esterase [Thozetella sp. PMI_491]
MDFSQYAKETVEWKEYLAAHPNLLKQQGSPNVQSLDNIRQAANAQRAQWSEKHVKSQGLEGKFTIKDYQVSTRDGSAIPLRFYAPSGSTEKDETKRPAFFHVHGGGYLNGSLDTETSVCAAIAVNLNMIVLHPEYRHTNSHSHPTQHHDVWDAFEWALANAEVLGFDPGSVVVGGQSAGSGLAASTAQQDAKLAKQEGRACRIRGQVLTIPWLMHPAVFPYHRFADNKLSSPVQCAGAIGLSSAKLDWFASLLRVSDPSDPILNPGFQQGSELYGLPKAAFLVAGGDPLRDQGLLYAKDLDEARVPTTVRIFPAMPHTFRSIDVLSSAASFNRRLIESVAWALSEQTWESGGASRWQIEKGN